MCRSPRPPRCWARWVFCNEKRDFNDRETNILEVVAGRLASDLEREMLLRAGTDGAELQKQVAAAERLQRNALPTISPLLDGWDVAGWTAQADGVGGAFHDWFCLPRGLLAVAVGKAAEQGVAGALTANAVKTAVRPTPDTTARPNASFSKSTSRSGPVRPAINTPRCSAG